MRQPTGRRTGRRRIARRATQRGAPTGLPAPSYLAWVLQAVAGVLGSVWKSICPWDQPPGQPLGQPVGQALDHRHDGSGRQVFAGRGAAMRPDGFRVPPGWRVVGTADREVVLSRSNWVRWRRPECLVLTRDAFDGPALDFYGGSPIRVNGNEGRLYHLDDGTPGLVLDRLGSDRPATASDAAPGQHAEPRPAQRTVVQFTRTRKVTDAQALAFLAELTRPDPPP